MPVTITFPAFKKRVTVPDMPTAELDRFVSESLIPSLQAQDRADKYQAEAAEFASKAAWWAGMEQGMENVQQAAAKPFQALRGAGRWGEALLLDVAEGWRSGRMPYEYEWRNTASFWGQGLEQAEDLPGIAELRAKGLAGAAPVGVLEMLPTLPLLFVGGGAVNKAKSLFDGVTKQAKVFAPLMAGQTIAESPEDLTGAGKAALMGATFPVASAAGRGALEQVALKVFPTMGNGALQMFGIAGSQAMIDTVALTERSPEIAALWQEDPEAAKALMVQIVAGNLAFEVPSTRAALSRGMREAVAERIYDEYTKSDDYRGMVDETARLLLDPTLTGQPISPHQLVRLTARTGKIDLVDSGMVEVPDYIRRRMARQEEGTLELVQASKDLQAAKVGGNEAAFLAARERMITATRDVLGIDPSAPEVPEKYDTELELRTAEELLADARSKRPLDDPRVFSQVTLRREPEKLPTAIQPESTPLKTAKQAAKERKQDAIQERSPTALPVGETPSRGAELGKEVRNAEEPAKAGKEAEVATKTVDALEKWADQKILDALQRSNVLSPDLLAAGVTKGAILISRGVVSFAHWASEMVGLFGETIKPHLQELFTRSQQAAQANKTARTTGAVGARAITPAYVATSTKPGESVLNFGAGKPDSTGHYLHSDMVRAGGGVVSEYDFGKNAVGALGKAYDTVFASNVLNVQANLVMLRDTLTQIRDSTVVGGRAVFNLPESPRYSDLSVDVVAKTIADIFGEKPTRVGGTNRAPLWEVRRSTVVVPPERPSTIALRNRKTGEVWDTGARIHAEVPWEKAPAWVREWLVDPEKPSWAFKSGNTEALENVRTTTRERVVDLREAVKLEGEAVPRPTVAPVVKPTTHDTSTGITPALNKAAWLTGADPTEVSALGPAGMVLRMAERIPIQVARATILIAAHPLRYYFEELPARLARLGGKNSQLFSTVAKDAVAAAKEVRGRYADILDSAMNLTRKRDDFTDWINGHEQIPGTEIAIDRLFMLDPDYRGIFKGKTIPAKFQQQMNALGTANYAIGQMAKEGIPDSDPRGRIQRIMTPYFVDLIRSGNYEALARAAANIPENRRAAKPGHTTGKLNKMTTESTGLRWTTSKPGETVAEATARFMELFDSMREDMEQPGQWYSKTISQEHVRRIPVMPSKMQVAGPFGIKVWVPLLEARPFSYFGRAADIVAHRVGVLKVLGGGDSLKQWRQLIIDDKKPGAATAFDDLVRALHGMPLDTPWSLGISPTSKTGMAIQGMHRAFTDIIHPLALTKAWTQNTAESVAGATPWAYGYDTYIEAAHRLESTYAELESMGAVTRSLLNYSKDPDAPVISAMRAFRNTVNVADLQRWMNENQEGLAAMSAYITMERARAGNLTGEAQRRVKVLAKVMGFTEAEASSLVRGTASSNLQRQFIQRSAPTLTSGAKSPAEKSRMAHNRMLNFALPFQSYSMARMNLLYRYAQEAKLGDKDATHVLGKMLFGNLAQGALQTAVSVLATGGAAKLAIMLNEAEDDPIEFFADAMVGAVGGPYSSVAFNFQDKGFADLFRGENWNLNMTFPGGVANEVMGVLTGKTYGPSVYANKSFYERALQFTQSRIPITKVVRTVALAAGAAGGEGQQELEAAIAGLNRWQREQFGRPGGSAYQPAPEREEFLLHMRRFVNDLKSGNLQSGELSQAIQANPRGARGFVDSLRYKKTLQYQGGVNRGKPISPQDLAVLRARLGPSAVRTLQGFDAVVDGFADAVAQTYR